MTKVFEMDKRVSKFSQMNVDTVPVIMTNKFDAVPSESDEFIKGLAEEARKFNEQPGVHLRAITQRYWRKWDIH